MQFCFSALKKISEYLFVSFPLAEWNPSITDMIIFITMLLAFLFFAPGKTVLKAYS